MTTLSFYARTLQSATTSGVTLRNVQQAPPTLLVFTETDGGALSFTYNNGQPDPDTVVFVNGQAQTFTVSFTGITGTDNKLLTRVNGVDLRQKQFAVITLQDGTSYFFFTDPSITFLTMQQLSNGAHTYTDRVTSGKPLFLCFTKGTRIATPFGERRVESLCPGDLVLTADGRATRLRWVAHRHLTAAELLAHPDLAPIRIPAGRFGPGRPFRRLEVSPQHRIRLDGWQVELLFATPEILVPAKHLLGMGGIEQIETPAGVDYYHLLFDRHEIILSNGLETESYQPSARTLDAMDAATRDEFLRLFGRRAAAMLDRPDALPSVTARESAALRQMVAAA